MIKRLTKIGFICCLGASVVSLVLSVWSVSGSPGMSGKLVTLGGILLALAGVLQLEVSNFFLSACSPNTQIWNDIQDGLHHTLHDKL